MIRNIGKVILNYNFYKGEDLYSDGDIENVILKAVKEGTQEELFRTSSSWPVLYHLSEMRENLLEWYPMTKQENVLEIGSGCGALTGLLSRKAGQVTCIELSERRSLINAYKNRECDNVEIMIGNFQDIEPKLEENFDYITLIGVWEYSALYIDSATPYLEMLKICKRHLKPGGKIIIAIENKMGLKYWNGAPEDHTGGIYDGLHDYRSNNNVRTFSKNEIEDQFRALNMMDYVFYYPMPDYKLPDTIYSDEVPPAPGMLRYFGQDYNAPRRYNFNDAVVSDQVCSDKMFSYFANSFLIVVGEARSEKLFIKYNRHRHDQFCIKTEICRMGDRIVAKKEALTEIAKEHILSMKSNEEKCKESITVIGHVCGWNDNDSYVAPYFDGIDLEADFYHYCKDIDLFMQRCKLYIDTFFHVKEESLIPFQISEEFLKIFGDKYPDNKKCKEITNVDMVFSNIRILEGEEKVCFDYEWVFEFPIPYEFVIWRCAFYLYTKYKAYLIRHISEKDFLMQFGIAEENISIYENMEICFQNYTCSEEKFLLRFRKNAAM